KQAQKLARQLYDAFLGTDASQIEINPLAVTEQGQLLVLDAKVGFDSNAMFRHHDLEALRDESEEDPMELEASKFDLAYIKLDGNNVEEGTRILADSGPAIVPADDLGDAARKIVAEVKEAA